MTRLLKPVGLLVAGAQPSGTIARETFEAFKAEILTRLRDAAPIDAVVLVLHGAGVVVIGVGGTHHQRLSRS